MKKLFLLILVLALALGCFASCDMLPESVQDGIDSVLGMVGLGGDDADDAHEHSFALVESKAANCVDPGKDFYECECGETNEVVTAEALGHNYEKTVLNEATCGRSGANRYKCTVCKDSYTEKVPATGEHVFDQTTEASRIMKCTGPSCEVIEFHTFENNKYQDVIVYSFSDDDLALFNAIFAELDAIIDAAVSYDPELHAYATHTDLYADYLAMEAKYEELYEILEFVVEQYQIAQIEYHCDMNNAEKEANFEYITEIRTDLVAEFYSFSKPIYDSMYREFYYYGMTDEEINEFLFDSDAVGNEEYQALTKRNSDIELEFDAIDNPNTDPRVLALYGEFVANNKRIAEILGYENYLEYAYKNVYDRDYSYTDVATIAEYVKEYIVPVYIAVYDEWTVLTTSGGLTQNDVDAYYAQVNDSFFDYYESNVYLNDYIDLLSFTSNPDKQISFSDELNALVSDGNLFRGNYTGAYVTGLYSSEIPIAYFGPGYDSPFTVAHEFGHYMNEIYSGGKYSQSFDLLEMHSQGDEILFLSYLNGKIGKKGFALVETYNNLVMLDTIVTALAVDIFEQAVYTDYYEGTYSAQIMADGTITADEYDKLFQSIIADFGATGYTMSEYWRYVTIHAPCYYVSYSVSALSVLQLYPTASEDFDSAVDSYLKLFTYIDTLESEDDYMSTEDVLKYAGLYTYMEEELYASIYAYFLGSE